MLTNAEHMAELQRRLEAHVDYRPGMRFVLVPSDASPAQANGYSWEPAGTDEPMRTIAGKRPLH